MNWEAWHEYEGQKAKITYKRRHTTVWTHSKRRVAHSLADFKKIFLSGSQNDGHWIFDLARWYALTDSVTSTAGQPVSQPTSQELAELKKEVRKTTARTIDQKVTATNWLMKGVMDRLQILWIFRIFVSWPKQLPFVSIYRVRRVCAFERNLLCVNICVSAWMPNAEQCARTISRGH